MIPLLLLLAVSAALAAALTVLSKRPVVSWLVGSVIPCVAFQLLNEFVNGADSFKYIAFIVSMGLALMINGIVVAVASEMDE